MPMDRRLSRGTNGSVIRRGGLGDAQRSKVICKHNVSKLVFRICFFVLHISIHYCVDPFSDIVSTSCPSISAHRSLHQASGSRSTQGSGRSTPGPDVRNYCSKHNNSLELTCSRLRPRCSSINGSTASVSASPGAISRHPGLNCHSTINPGPSSEL